MGELQGLDQLKASSELGIRSVFPQNLQRHIIECLLVCALQEHLQSGRECSGRKGKAVEAMEWQVTELLTDA